MFVCNVIASSDRRFRATGNFVDEHRVKMLVVKISEREHEGIATFVYTKIC